MSFKFEPGTVKAWLIEAWLWLKTEMLVPATLIQAGAILAALTIARLIDRPITRWLDALTDRLDWIDKPPGQFIKAAVRLGTPIIALALIAIGNTLAAELSQPHYLLSTAASLMAAWVVIRLSSSVVRNPAWAKAITWTAMGLAALNILELLDPAIDLLDALDVTFGQVRISVLGVLKGVVVLAVLVKLASIGSSLLDKRLKDIPGLTPSVEVLLAKAIRIFLFTLAIMLAMSSVGIDLTHLAFFSGAVGLGVGFGLQKVISNLVSGVILLLDKSIKPGDVITVGDTFGRIVTMSARYVSVVTRDGTEFLIPNEDLITRQVVNWSYTNRLIRVKINVGVSYDTDLKLARELCLEAAARVERVLSHPKPVCHVVDFGDSSIDLQLRVWIGDPENGVTNVMSAVRLALWELFTEHKIEIPFPQRDVHIRDRGKREILGE